MSCVSYEPRMNDISKYGNFRSTSLEVTRKTSLPKGPTSWFIPTYSYGSIQGIKVIVCLFSDCTEVCFTDDFIQLPLQINS